MAQEIGELGIEPIQIFGLSRNQKKNAADIQLAVDAIDLAYMRPWLDVFVIVSGDGGFSALAKKLHECGRTVIGCAYQSSTNKIFESVCDVFLGIREPETNTHKKSEPEELLPKTNSVTESLKITNPIILRMSQTIERLSSKDFFEMINHSKTILNWLNHDPESFKLLTTHGIYLSVIKEAFKYGIENFDPALIGFSKFILFLQFVTTGTPLKVVNSSKSEVKIIARSHTLANFEALSDIDQDYIHSVDNYRSILESGEPRFRIVSFPKVREILQLIYQLVPETVKVNYLLEYLNQNNLDPMNSEVINRSVTNLLSSEIIEKPEGDPHISEINLVIKSNYETVESIIDKMKKDMFSKLSIFWKEDFREEIFDQLIDELEQDEI
jgi:hypothetical protein